MWGCRLRLFIIKKFKKDREWRHELKQAILKRFVGVEIPLSNQENDGLIERLIKTFWAYYSFTFYRIKKGSKNY